MNPDIKVRIEHAARLIVEARRLYAAYTEAHASLARYFIKEGIATKGECRCIQDHQNVLEHYVGKTLVKDEMGKLDEPKFNGISAPVYQGPGVDC